MLSGGIDSTGVLHRLCTHPDYSGYTILVHHIYIVNRENRHEAEANAVKKIIEYYAKTKDFLYTQSVFNTSGFAPLRSPRFPFDMDVCAFIAGNLCAARPDIKFVAMGRTKTDIDSGGDNFQKRMGRAQGIFRSVLSLEQERGADYIFPVATFTKEEIWAFLPNVVKSNTWWCRTPVYEGGVPISCGRCGTCKDVKAFINA